MSRIKVHPDFDEERQGASAFASVRGGSERRYRIDSDLCCQARFLVFGGSSDKEPEYVQVWFYLDGYDKGFALSPAATEELALKLLEIVGKKHVPAEDG